MTFDWQNVVALTVVAMAVIEIARRAWKLLVVRGSQTGCGGCSICPSRSSGERQLVTLVPPYVK